MPKHFSRDDLQISDRLLPRHNVVPSIDIDFRCRGVCGRCQFISDRSKQRCKKMACLDYRFCPLHLPPAVHLYIGAKSRHLSSLNPPIHERGVYAADSNRALNVYGVEDGIPIVADNLTVFKKGDLVDVYGGERMTKKELDKRYVDDDAVATYAYSKGRSAIDGYCASTALAYANDPYDPNSADPHKFSAAKRAANIRISHSKHGHMWQGVALRDIKHGEEILNYYGRSYWQ